MNESIQKVNELKEQIINEINAANDAASLRSVQEKHLSKKSPLSGMMSLIKELNGDERIAFGQTMNDARKAVSECFASKEKAINDEIIKNKLEKEKIDITLPSVSYKMGGINPFYLIQDEMMDIFTSMGYQVVEGPDVESDYFNFERMNIPANHPAREMQDSFYITNSVLLRTHTSPAQAHAMDAAKGQPLKIICPGKCYRRDDDDATHSHQFGQIEGLVIDKGINLGNLKATLELFLRKMFGEKREVRFRSSYFPFTEPSVEVDISCMECHGKGCPICKGTGYIEILGAGMVHPHVLEMSGYDPKEYSGFAFGIGIERVAMLRYGIDDIRKFYQGDVRFIEQFTRK